MYRLDFDPTKHSLMVKVSDGRVSLQITEEAKISFDADPKDYIVAVIANLPLDRILAAWAAAPAPEPFFVKETAHVSP